MLRRVVPYLIYIILVGGLITVIVLAFNSDNSGQPAKSTVTSTVGKGAAGESITVTPQGSNPQPSGSSSGSSSSSSSSPTPSTSQSSSSNASGKLVNTGPGDVWAVFLGGVVVGSVGFSLYQKRQNSIY